MRLFMLFVISLLFVGCASKQTKTMRAKSSASGLEKRWLNMDGSKRSSFEKQGFRHKAFTTGDSHFASKSYKAKEFKSKTSLPKVIAAPNSNKTFSTKDLRR